MGSSSFGLYDLHRLGSASDGQRLRWRFVWPGYHSDVRSSVCSGLVGNFLEHDAVDPLLDCAAIAGSNVTTRLSEHKIVRFLRRC